MFTDMRIFRKNFMRGFGLIEIIVALAMLVTSFASLYGVVQLSSRALRKAADRSQAAFLIEEAPEMIRYLRDTSWSGKIPAASPNPYCLDTGWHSFALNNQQDNKLMLHMNEKNVTTGTRITDASGQNNHGTFQAGAGDTVNKANTTATTSIQFGSALTFDGINDYTDVPLAADPTAYTIEAWVYPKDTTQSNIFGRASLAWPTAAISHELYIKTGGFFSHYTFDGSSRWVDATVPFQINMWHHVVGTAQNGGQMRLYVDGGEVGTAIFGVGTLWTDGNRYIVGGQSLPGCCQYFKGDIDEVLVYNRVLSATEIADHYRAGPPCQKFDDKFTRTVFIGDVCRDNSTNDIISTTFSTCTTGTIDPNTKFAQIFVGWDQFVEFSYFYFTNLFVN